MKRIRNLGLMATLLFSCTKYNDQARNISAFKANEYSVSAEVIKLSESFKSVDSLGSAQESIDNVSDDFMESSKWNTLPEDYKLVSALLLPLTEFRAVGHRALGIRRKPAKSVARKHLRAPRRDRLVESIIASQLYKLTSSFSIFFPTSGQRLIDYMTVPYKGMGEEFHSIGDVQNHMMGKVYPQFQRAIEILDSIKVEQPIVVDSTLFAEKGVTIPESRRYIVVRKHDIEALKAAYHKHSHDMIVYSHYDRNDTIRFEMKLAKKSSVFSGFHPGITIKNRESIINDYPRLFTLRKIPYSHGDHYKSWMDEARNHALTAIKHDREFVREVEALRKISKGQKVQSVIHPKVSDYIGERNRKSLDFREQLLTTDEVSVRNPVTGEFATVNHLKFYENPPRDLKVFVPNAFETEQRKTLKNDKIKYPNYNYGKAKGWKVEKYAEYFPSVKTNEDVKSLLRVLGGVNEVQGISSTVGTLGTLTPVTKHPNFSSF